MEASALRLAQVAARRERDNRLLSDLDAFLPALEKVMSDRRKLIRQTAPGFNVFRSLGLQYERNHTAILADFLNPAGSHGQGLLFLDQFLQEIGRADLSEILVRRASLVLVSTEAPIKDRRRLDILIRCGPDFVVVIENKIRAPEHDDQLRRYKTWLTRQPEREKVLIFLTIHGEKSTSLTRGYIPVSYTNHIQSWLESSRNGVLPASLHVVLDHYIEAVKDLRSLKEAPENGDW